MTLRNSESGIRYLSRVLAGFAVGLTVCAPIAYAQGCALCANDASALKAHALAALRSGVLVLLIPPLLFFIGIFAFAFHHSDPAADCSVGVPIPRTRDDEDIAATGME